MSTLSYIGADIVEPLIEQNRQRYGSERKNFRQLDLTADTLPQVDVIFCRECLVHLSFENIFKSLANIKRSGSVYLFTTHFPDIRKNYDVVTGKHRSLNFTLAPFNWPRPDFLFEEYDAGKRRGMKCLGIWKISSLPEPGLSAQMYTVP